MINILRYIQPGIAAFPVSLILFSVGMGFLLFKNTLIYKAPVRRIPKLGRYPT